jgi:hypothetical protein
MKGFFQKTFGKFFDECIHGDNQLNEHGDERLIQLANSTDVAYSTCQMLYVYFCNIPFNQEIESAITAQKYYDIKN